MPKITLIVFLLDLMAMPLLGATPKNLVGAWQVTGVLIDTEATRTVHYQLNDERLLKRILVITSQKWTFNTPEPTQCENPTFRRQRTTPARLVEETMAGQDYALPLAD